MLSGQKMSYWLYAECNSVFTKFAVHVQWIFKMSSEGLFIRQTVRQTKVWQFRNVQRVTKNVRRIANSLDKMSWVPKKLCIHCIQSSMCIKKMQIVIRFHLKETHWKKKVEPKQLQGGAIFMSTGWPPFRYRFSKHDYSFYKHAPLKKGYHL